MAGRKTMRHSEDWWSLVAGPTDVRCEAHVQSGDRCRRAAIAGANVCRQHGGAIPAVKAKAAARIGNAADAMVQRLHAMLDDPAVDAREKIKIAQDMLDRAGLNATNKLLVGVGEVDPVERLFRDLLSDPSGLVDVEAARALPLPAGTFSGDGEDSPLLSGWRDDNIVDAEVVEDGGTVPAWSTNDEAWSYGPPERVSKRPPKHIREAMERLI
jgi:hypothetical protein